MFKNCTFGFLYFFIFLFSIAANAQLTDFTLSVTKTDESCTGNGSLAFNATDTTVGATIVYTVYLLPNTTNPIATQSGNNLGGLVAGTYRVIATQTLGNLSNTQQQDIAIVSTIVPLTYDLAGTPGVCENGSIVVNVVTGTAVNYEIISGPVIVPLQPSNVFNLLPPGVYQIRVFDNCGEGVVKNFTLTGSTPGLSIGATTYPSATLPTCDEITIRHTLVAPAGTVIAYPLTIEITVFPPSGPSVVFTQTVLNGSPNSAAFSMDIPLFAGTLYSYNIKIVDGCGNEYIRNGNNVNKNLTVSLSTPPVDCGKALSVSPGNFVAPYTVNFISTPAGFNPTTYNGAHPGPFTDPAQYYNPGVPIPNGLYVVEITDSCGRTAQSQIEFVNNTNVQPLAVDMKKGCDETHGSVKIISQNGSLVSVVITSAPAAYTATLPQDVSFNIADANSIFYMNSLPAGTYVFHTLDSCGNILDATIVVEGSQVSLNTVEITPNCASFNLELHHTSNVSTQNEFFWLQEFNPLTGLWGHPATGVSNNQPPGIFNAWLLNNNAVNINLQFSGIFRILKSYEIFENGETYSATCVQEIYNFEFDGFPKIEAVYSFSCSNDASDVIIIASGAGPLIYRITLKNGQPFSVPDQSSNLFSGLEPAIYNFQVEDACGNVLNRLYDVTEPLTLSVAPLNLCDGQPGSLTLPALPFLEFEWWKGNDTANILSTTNTLSFAAFNAATDSGLYHVSVVYPNENSCIDLVLDFEVSPNLSNPNAGVNILNSYCGNQGVIDLFAILPGSPDTFGTWTEVTSSGTLQGHLWDSTNVAPGTYVFQYRVDGLCGIFDESEMTLTIFSQPETPVAFIEQIPCEAQSLVLLATTIPDVTYSWTGPNNFTSSEQNPVIQNLTEANNGTYSVQVSNEFCTSGIGTVQVLVFPSPEFAIEQACIDDVYTLTAVLSDTADQIDFTYSWTGPDNFSASGNPIVITGESPGTYTLLASFANDCPSTQSIEVLNTQCTIPKGVSPNSDGDNDTFDLSGFDIDELRIFNRYGMKVFEQENYIDQWHGQDYKGHELPSATYYYLLHLADGQVKSGWVYLQQKG